MCKISSCQELYGCIYNIMVTLCKISSLPAFRNTTKMTLSQFHFSEPSPPFSFLEKLPCENCFCCNLWACKFLCVHLLAVEQMVSSEVAFAQRWSRCKTQRCSLSFQDCAARTSRESDSSSRYLNFTNAKRESSQSSASWCFGFFLNPRIGNP